jgi:hypothetical protein
LGHAVPTGIVFLVLAILLIGAWAALHGVRRRRRLDSKVQEAVDRHIDKLIALRAELLSYGSTGELTSREWDQEIERFMHSQVAESVTPAEAKALERRHDDVTRLIAARVAQAAASPIWYHG